MQDCKIVVVGDGGVGKSSLLITCTKGSFPGEYVPTVFDNYRRTFTVENRHYNVGLWDTAGQEDYDRLRLLAYIATDVFVLCFDVQSRNSFQNIEEKWLPELKGFSPDTGIIIVANKIDLRNNRITTEEGKNLAQKHGLTYLECSALTQEGIHAVIPTAIRTAFTCAGAINRKKSKRFWFQGRFFSSNKSDEPQPPVMPPAGLAPWINITTSTFAEDWQHLLTDDLVQPDVKFISGSNTIFAHQVVLSASSVIFKEIFLMPKKMNQVPYKYTKLFEDIKWIFGDLNTYLNNLNVEATDIDNRECAEITLNHNINFEVFRKILQFLYTGLPGFSEVEDKNFVCELNEASKLFHLTWLTQVCKNQLEDEKFLNPSIGTWLNDETGSVMKTLFLNKSTLSDVQFVVEGKTVYAHKAVLMARCDVMAAMLGGRFMESKHSTMCEIRDTNFESFMAILEYLYTDHAPIEEMDSINIMVLADRFCLPRLVTLCELYITKKVDRMIEKKVADGVEFVVNLLLLSQAHNATQLSKWCLHFIATNYSVFESSDAFSLLQGENKEYVQEHRWPPLSYLKELEEYQNKINSGETKEKCKVM